MSVSSKLAGIGIGAGAALALFAFAAPSAAADTATATGSEATSVVVGTITGHSLTSPTGGSVAITIQRSSNGQIVPLRPIYLPMCGFCASAH